MSSFINETLKSFTDEYIIWHIIANTRLSTENSIEHMPAKIRTNGTFRGREIIAFGIKLLLGLKLPKLENKVLAKIPIQPSNSPIPSRTPT
mmetsp:Transcript_26431/g.62083  ORF Transcript_26431/g.62083 Transcript_26431/m.62083 type:complete len:91 (-) Transcript_26431:2540-2812(-)